MVRKLLEILFGCFCAFFLALILLVLLTPGNWAAG